MQVETLKTIENKELSGPLAIKPQLFEDKRGFFYESWNQRRWNEILVHDGQQPVNFVQDNHSYSEKGVLRGLHYQLNPYSQGKLVRCIGGKIYDVVIDIRRSSPLFGNWAGIELSADNKIQLWIPSGFAHGFLTLSDKAEVLYKTTDFWNSTYERGIIWNDPQINIKWPEVSQVFSLSRKDLSASRLDNLSNGELFL